MMDDTVATRDPEVTGSAAPPQRTDLAQNAATQLICLPTMANDQLRDFAKRLSNDFVGRRVILASTDAAEEGGSDETGALPGMELVGYTPSTAPVGGWTLNATDFLNAYELYKRYGTQAVLILGPEAQSLQSSSVAALASAALDHPNDLAVARYELSPRAGLANSSILYPVTRALFAARLRFPQALDLAVSPRMLERLATAAQKLVAANQPGGLLWPIAEAATAGFSMTEVAVGPRSLPQPDSADLNTLLALVTGSLFGDVDAKAAWWQRARPVSPGRVLSWPDKAAPDAGAMEQVKPMLETFYSAYANLHEIWSLVLPPQTLLGLKRLSTASPQNFQLANSLWARIVYDFLLAYRLRTINRNHLLGALTPLYLAWVASHILLTAAGGDPEQHIESQAAAFEADKPYLVSRWRWPDRFNP